MSRKLYGLLLPVLAIAAFASVTGAAQAAPKWKVCVFHSAATFKYSDSHCVNLSSPANTGHWELEEVGNAEHKVRVATFGVLTLKGALTIECQVIDNGKIWNTATGGKDEIIAFVNYECVTEMGTCPTPEIVAEKLPWSSKLAAGPIDEIEGIQVKVICSGTGVATFTGTLKPTLTNPTESTSLIANFTNATGKLKNGVEEGEVIGEDHIVTTTDQQIKVE
jgi:hypothetical protein